MVYVRSLKEVIIPACVLSSLCALFLFSAYRPAVARIVCFILSGTMFGMIALIASYLVRDFLDELARDRDNEEARLRKLAEDVMES